jgi:hypothetical protein
MTAPDTSPLICDPNDIGEVALSIALAELGVREEGGNNRGARVEEYQSRVGGQPGDAWCAAFAYWSFDEAARKLGIVNPCPRFRGALKMWSEADAVCHTPTPARGRLCILDHGKGLGHVSIVEVVNADGTITDVSGNTNEKGSRAGNAVARHTWNPGRALEERGARLVGFVDLSKAPTRPVP